MTTSAGDGRLGTPAFVRRPEFTIILGALLALAFPPFPFGFLAPCALAGLLLNIDGLGPKAAASRGWVFGFVFHLGTLYWTGWVSIPGMIVMAIVLGLYIATVLGILAASRPILKGMAVWLFPIVWVAHEYGRGLGDLAFPWTNLSLSQVSYLPLIQFADTTGDLGVSFWVALVGVLLFRLYSGWSHRGTVPRLIGMAALVAAVTLPLFYGFRAMDGLKPGDRLRVAVLQGDIDSYHKWDSAYVDQSFAVYEAQSRAAAAHGAELIVWPETAAPVYLRAEVPDYRRVRALAADIGVPILLGTLEYKALDHGGYLSYNAAVAVDRKGYYPAFHAKLHLVPLGEWIPFSDKIKILDELEVGGAHFTAGDKYVLFDHPRGPYAAAICYESVLPDIMRNFAIRGARFYVNITNDGWYGFSSGPTQHALIAVYRAIETRRPIARSANTGISTVIDRTGRLIAPTRQYVPEVLVADMELGPKGEITPFMRHGMLLGQACAVISGLALVGVLVYNIRRKLAPTT